MFATREYVGSEIFDVSFAKTQVRALQEADDEDQLIEHMIAAAREYCENITGRAFRPCRVTAYPENTADLQRLPMIPVMAEDIILQKRDANGEYLAMERSGYILDAAGGTLRIPSAGGGADDASPYRLTYQAGYPEGETPAAAIQAMLMLIGHWYQNRESVQTGAVATVEIEMSTRNLLKQYRAWWY